MITTIGILGGGQLGRMLTEAATALGFQVVVVDPTPHCPAAQVGAEQIVAAYDDVAATKKLAQQADVITIEFEHVNAAVLTALQTQNALVHPAPATIQLIQDKLQQKRTLRAAGLPVANFEPVAHHTYAETKDRLGAPFHLKSRRGAFDGRGNRRVQNEAEFATAHSELGAKALYAEQHVPFVKELSVLIARDRAGQTQSYPVVETVHRNNICHLVYSPARIADNLAQQAEALAQQAVELLDGASMFAVELFLDADQQLFINEIAPRVHNSGHHTSHGNHTSQFEQHIRAVSGLPLGETSLKSPATVMINLLGERDGATQLEGLDAALAVPRSHVYIYGKSPTKKNRKMGHVTVCADTMEQAEQQARKAHGALRI